MVRKTGNPHFVYDSYRRFVQMYGDVVLGMKPVNKEDIDPFEAIIDEVKAIRGIELDKDLSVDELKDLVARFKKASRNRPEMTSLPTRWSNSGEPSAPYSAVG